VTSSWLEEIRNGLKMGSLKVTRIMLEKLALEGVHTEETSVETLGEISFKYRAQGVHTEETSVGTLGEISFKYRAQGNREIRTVGEFFTLLVRWARGVLTAGTIVVGEGGCGPGVRTMGGHGAVGAAASNWRLHATLTEVFALLQYHFVLADQPAEVHLAYAEIMSGVKSKMLSEQCSFSSAMSSCCKRPNRLSLLPGSASH